MARLWRRAAMFAAAALIIMAGPEFALAAKPADGDLRADLNGRPIPLVDVGLYHCHDLSYPRIHCFARESDRDAAIAAPLAATGVDYVIAWEYSTYSGASIVFSSDYTVLATLGWNDRISSFKGRNSQSGHFWTDWFYGGNTLYFCCNQQYSSLGGFDDTFSSVHRG